MAGYAILTRYAGPTNYRGSRIIARGPSLTFGGRPVRAVVSWDDDPFGDHRDIRAAHARGAAAVVAQLRRAGWSVTLAPDWHALPDESGYVFTMDYGHPEPGS